MSRFSVRGRTLVFRFFIALAATIPPQSDEPFYAEKTQPAKWLIAKQHDWMSRLPDELLVSSLSIPGTHDSCAYGSKVGIAGAFARTQWWSLEDQLKAGVRFLDIRCRQVQDKFTIHHGQVYLGQDFAEVRNICESFLNENPSECLVMNVQREYKTVGDANFGEVFASYIEGEHAKYWETQMHNPKLGEARGKILLLSRNNELDERLSTKLRWSQVSIANDWNGPEFDAKWRGALDNMSLARKPEEQGPWFLTFTSATSLPFKTPGTYATILNERLFDWMGANPHGPIGLTAIDYPGNELIDRIIQSNFEKKSPSGSHEESPR
ncbi:MAG: phosphatidylinositol-specific phospholipase C [Planctomycetota bacterium]